MYSPKAPNQFPQVVNAPAAAAAIAAPKEAKQTSLSETVQLPSLPLECVHNVHGCDSLTTGVLRVGDRITDNVLKEDLEDSTGLFVDETRDTLHTTTTGQTTDSRLGNSLDVIAQNLTMTLGSSLSESLASFASACNEKW